MILLIVIWILLGIHSIWFFIKRYTQKDDLTTNEIPILVFCFLVPLVTQLATLACYPNLKPRVIKPKVIIKKSK